MELVAGIIGGAGVSLAALALIAYLARTAIDAAGSAGDARVESAATKAELAIARAALTTHTDRADTERRRADALDDALAEAARAPDPHGARERVLARWQQDHAASKPVAGAAAGDTPSSVPAPPAAGA